MNLADNRCPRCNKPVVRLWRCETGEWKGANLCYLCCEQMKIEASLAVTAEIEAMDKDVLREIAKRDINDLYGGG